MIKVDPFEAYTLKYESIRAKPPGLSTYELKKSNKLLLNHQRQTNYMNSYKSHPTKQETRTEVIAVELINGFWFATQPRTS